VRSLLVIQNAEHEDLGHFGPAFAQLGVQTKLLRAFAGEPIPERIRDHDALMVMGGPPHVYDISSGPWMKPVMELMRATHGRKPVLGVCLGAQMLAQALGGRAKPGPEPERGFGDLTLTEEGAGDRVLRGLEAPVLHLHGDTYDPPPGAIRLASSAKYREQAFRMGRTTYALQFHLDITAEALGHLAGRDAELGAIAQEAQKHDAHVAAQARKVAQGFASL